eukprot:COSAG05_NODE_1033_length_6088_cov_21.220738_4_plen_108_part_00
MTPHDRDPVAFSAKQAFDVRLASAPIANDTWGIGPAGDFAFASTGFTHLEGAAVHTRGVRHLRKHGVLVVVDHITTDRPRNVVAFWHAHPNCTVANQNPIMAIATKI